MALIKELELITDGLVFDEETHRYTYQGKELKSITRLLADQHISPSYDGVNQELLKKSAEYGNQVHKEIEDYVKTGKVGKSIELSNFIKWLETSGYEVVGCEYIVHNDNYAGKVDLLLRHKETGVYVIVDIKTTSTIHKESVSWQVSLYNYLGKQLHHEIEALVGLCLHFTKTGELEVESIAIKSDKDIESLLAADIDGKQFVYEIKKVDSAVAKVGELETLIKSYKDLIAQAQMEEELLKEDIRAEMESRNIKTLDLPNMKITIVEDSIRVSFDNKKFLKAHPEFNTDEWVKETPVKGGLKITFKKGDDEVA